ncbi:hypothetical protein SAMN05421636_108317 [Pricia antarctica]|uniref:Uncharacterized protein n=1 Tax=Pricia antarctica TaxID=641691 RepID=A0A1G7GWD5_9FLAO|nr:hypothetical protein SAMN05421636_108317 [Pricia antarctica]
MEKLDYIKTFKAANLGTEGYIADFLLYFFVLKDNMHKH